MAIQLCPFKTGDIVANRFDGRIYTVREVPGMRSYDQVGYGNANMGMIVEGSQWVQWMDFELAPFQSGPAVYQQFTNISPQFYNPAPTPVAPKKKRALVKPKVKENKEISLDSVIMSEEKRDQIKSAMSQIKNNDTIFNVWGFSTVFEKGTAISMLFYGIPGTGKTLTAQAVADELDSELKIYGTAEIESAEPGGAERMIKQIFDQARRATTSKKSQVVCFDECDSLLMDRNEVGPIIGAQINTLLQEIEKFPGVIIFTTNRLGKLDPALERRISAKIEFEFPNIEQRGLIWKRMIPVKAPLDEDVDLLELATYAIAGGNIKNAVLAAARMAAYRNCKTISMDHFVTAVESEVRSVQAFIDSYEDQTHPSLIRGGISREMGKVSIDKKVEVKKEKSPREMLGSMFGGRK